MDKSGYRHQRGGVSNLSYHVVWTPKRRAKVLVGLIELRLKEVLLEKAKEVGLEIGALEVMPDHVHLFVSAPTTLSPHQIVKRLKGASSNALRKEFPQLMRLPCMWSSSYYVGSIGFVSESIVRNYIENQKGK